MRQGVACTTWFDLMACRPGACATHTQAPELYIWVAIRVPMCYAHRPPLILAELPFLCLCTICTDPVVLGWEPVRVPVHREHRLFSFLFFFFFDMFPLQGDVPCRLCWHGNFLSMVGETQGAGSGQPFGGFRDSLEANHHGFACSCSTVPQGCRIRPPTVSIYTLPSFDQPV